MLPNVCIPQIWAYLAGCLTVFLLSPLLKYLKNLIAGEEPTKKKIYALHHAVLNIDIPPKSMWMNMGYWDVSKLVLLQEHLKGVGLISVT